MAGCGWTVWRSCCTAWSLLCCWSQLRDDVLSVVKEVPNIRSNIEGMEGRMTRLLSRFEGE